MRSRPKRCIRWATAAWDCRYSADSWDGASCQAENAFSNSLQGRRLPSRTSTASRLRWAASQGSAKHAASPSFSQRGARR